MAIWRDLNRGVEWTMTYFGFVLYTVTIISTRFPLAQIAVAIAVVGLALQKQRFRGGPFLTWMVAFYGWTWLGRIGTRWPGTVGNALEDFGKVVIIAIIGVNALRSRAQLRMLIVLILVAFALYPGRGSYLNYITGANLVDGRVIWNGTYANPNDLAVITLLMIGLCTSLIVSEGEGLLKRGAQIGNVLLVLLVSFTSSRGAMLGLIFMGLFTLARTRPEQRLRVFGATAAIIIVLIPFAPERAWTRLKGLTNVSTTNDMAEVDPEGSAKQRFAIWQVAVELIKDKPLTGVGFGAYRWEHYRMSMAKSMDPIARSPKDTHSTYLNVAAETGIIGFLLLGGLYWSVFAHVERIRRRFRNVLPTDAARLLAMEIGVIAFLFAGFWGSYAKLNITYLMLVMLWTGAAMMKDEGTAVLRAAAPAPRPLR